MSYPLTDETAIYALIFWIIGTDGSTSFKERQAAQRVLDTMQFGSEEEMHQAHNEFGALSTQNLNSMYNDAINYVKRNHSDTRKKFIYQLLETIASSSGNINKHEQNSLDKVKNEWGL